MQRVAGGLLAGNNELLQGIPRKKILHLELISTHVVK